MNLNIQASELINAYMIFWNAYWPIISLACALLFAPMLINAVKDIMEDRRYKKFTSKPFRVRTGTMAYYWSKKAGSHVLFRGAGRYRVKR